MVAATAACMAHAASLTEISKRDIWSPQRIAQERPDLQYKLVAIDFLPPKVGITDLSQICWQDRSASEELIERAVIPWLALILPANPQNVLVEARR